MTTPNRSQGRISRTGIATGARPGRVTVETVIYVNSLRECASLCGSGDAAAGGLTLGRALHARPDYSGATVPGSHRLPRTQHVKLYVCLQLIVNLSLEESRPLMTLRITWLAHGATSATRQ